MAAPHLDKPESPRAGFRVIRDEDAPAYDGQAQPKQGYTRVPELVRAMNDGFALAVFEAIARNDNGSHESWPSIKTICDRTGWSRKVVEPAIKRLIEAGALAKERRNLRGMDQASLYRITAWNQVVPRELPVVPTAPAVVPTERMGSSHGTSGSFPQNYKQEPVDQEPKEQEPVTPPAKPLPEHGAAQRIVKAYCLVARLEQPANYGRAVGTAQRLADAGVTPEQIPDLYEYVAGWAKGADLNSMLSQVDKWRSSKTRPTANGSGPSLPSGFTLPPGWNLDKLNESLVYRKAGRQMHEDRERVVDAYFAAQNGATA